MRVYSDYNPVLDFLDNLLWILIDMTPLLALLLLITLLIIMKKAPSTFWKNFSGHLKSLYLYVAAFVGLIMTIVAAITLTTTALESHVFGVEYDYVDYWECEYGEKGYMSSDVDEMTDEEWAECEARVLDRAKEDYQNDAKKDYASGLAGVIFGLILWIPHFMMARRLK